MPPENVNPTLIGPSDLGLYRYVLVYLVFDLNLVALLARYAASVLHKQIGRDVFTNLNNAGVLVVRSDRGVVGESGIGLAARSASIAEGIRSELAVPKHALYYARGLGAQPCSSPILELRSFICAQVSRRMIEYQIGKNVYLVHNGHAAQGQLRTAERSGNERLKNDIFYLFLANNANLGVRFRGVPVKTSVPSVIFSFFSLKNCKSPLNACNSPASRIEPSGTFSSVRPPVISAFRPFPVTHVPEAGSSSRTSIFQLVRELARILHLFYLQKIALGIGVYNLDVSGDIRLQLAKVHFGFGKVESSRQFRGLRRLFQFRPAGYLSFYTVYIMNLEGRSRRL